MGVDYKALDTDLDRFVPVEGYHRDTLPAADFLVTEYVEGRSLHRRPPAAVSLVVRPKTQDLNYVDVVKDLIHQPMLDIDAA